MPELKSATRTNVTVSLGPIGFTASVHTAVESEDATGLVNVCVHPASTEAGAPSRIRRTDACPVCENSDKATFRKAKIEGGTVKVLPVQELARAAETGHACKDRVELTVHPAKQLTKAFHDGTSYYLKPQTATVASTYAVLATVLERRQDLAFVGEFAVKGVARFYQLVVLEGTLVLRQLARPELVRDRPVNDAEPNITWVTMAEQFADAISTDFDPGVYADRRREILAAAVTDVEGLTLAGADTKATPTGGTDLGEVLKAELAKLAAAAPPAPKRRTRKAG